MKIKKILSSLLAATMLFGSVSANAVTVETDDMPKASKAVAAEVSGEEVINKDDYDMCDNIEDGAILHAWSWSFNTIADNMKDIAEAGYTAIQTSPVAKCYDIGEKYPTQLQNTDYDYLMTSPNPNILDKDGKTFEGTGGAWWWNYQPVKLEVGNYQLGTRAEYGTMCTEAEKYGIKIITDIVSNHTTAHYKLNNDYVEDTSSEIDVDAEYAQAVGGYNQLYHSTGFTDKKDAPSGTHTVNYMSGGLPDVNTENPKYQAYLVEYLNDLISLGCDGFRFDMAHNIGVSSYDGVTYNFWEKVTGKESVTVGTKTVQLGDTNNDGTIDVSPSSLYFYGEMLYHDYDSSYDDFIRITDDTYGQKLRKAVNRGSVAKSNIKDSSNLNGYSVTWVESHDDYCNDEHKSCFLTEDDIKFSWAVLTARNVGTPLFFNRPNGSNALDGNYWGNRSENENYNKIGAIGNDQFKDPEIAAVNHFRNAMVEMGADDEQVKNINNNNQLLQIDRYKSSDVSVNGGSCLINLSYSDQYIETTTKMSDGTYVDSVSDGIFIVSNGKLTGCVPARKIAVIYNLTTANLAAISETNTFDTATVTATLGISNANNGKYYFIIDGTKSSENTFNDGNTITIGSGVAYEKAITLVLSATDSAGNAVKKFYNYRKTHNTNPLYVYFDNSGYGWENVYAYLYTGSGSTAVNNAAWPGERMTIDKETGYYKYEIPYDLRSGRIIFTESPTASTNRYPADKVDGLQLNDTTTVFRNNSLNTISSTESVIAQTDNSYNNETTFDIQTKKYLYFFNSFAWTDVKISLSGGTAQPMTWSDTLHCYYWEYNSSDVVTSVTFSGIYNTTGKSDGVQNASYTTTDVQPGKMMVPKSVSSGTWTCSWAELNKIASGKLYLNFQSNTWDKVRASVSNASGAKNMTWPGAEMVFVGTDINGFDGDLYSYTYYYVDGFTTTKYNQVKFNNRANANVSSSESNNTNDLTINTTNDVCIIPNGNSPTSNVTIKKVDDAVEVNQEITVNYKYYDREVGNSGTAKERTKQFSYTATTSDLNSVVESSIGELGFDSVFDNHVYFNSQLEYVLGIGSYYDSNSKRNNSLTYSGRINPKFLSNKTSSFGGRFGDDIGNLSVSGENWVTYYDGVGNVVNPDDVLPDLSNVSTINIWGFSEPKKYQVTFYYPKATTAPAITVADNLKTSKSYAGNEIYSCLFDQLPESQGNSLTPGIVLPKDYVFDGWYKIDFDGNNVKSYVKVTSNQEYNLRVTQDMTLYAVYAPENAVDTTKSASVTANSIDHFVNDNNGLSYHYNTMLNIFNCDDSDNKITDVGVAYVNLSGSQDVNYSDVQTNLKSIIGNGTSSSSTGTYPYHYYQYSIENNEVTLTNKNRIQFTFTLSDSQLDGNYGNVAVFAVYKYDGQNDWVISDNCVQYKYDSKTGTVTITEMNR